MHKQIQRQRDVLLSDTVHLAAQHLLSDTVHLAVQHLLSDTVHLAEQHLLSDTVHLAVQHLLSDTVHLAVQHLLSDTVHLAVQHLMQWSFNNYNRLINDIKLQFFLYQVKKRNYTLIHLMTQTRNSGNILHHSLFLLSVGIKEIPS
jgi:hypothetical protein